MGIRFKKYIKYGKGMLRVCLYNMILATVYYDESVRVKITAAKDDSHLR